MKILLKNATLYSNTNELETKNVLITDHKISKISSADIGKENIDDVIDCKGNLLVPGFIDVHIHLREPGGEQKETIKTGTNAAARGGFTTVCAMPNTNPVPDSSDKLIQLHERIKQDALIRVLPYAAITEGLQGETIVNMEELSNASCFAFTDDGVGIQSADMMYRAMKQAVAVNKPIVAHCEDNSLVYEGVIHDGDVSKRLHLPGIPSISESVHIARDVLLAEATGCHYHVCHVSTKESVRVIRDAKKAGIHVTAEVSPHHLVLNETDIQSDNAQFKMNPPLRSKKDQQALLEGLLDGTIDFIATDHAPHTASEKEKGFLEAPFGIVGLETAFPILYTSLVETKKVTLKQLIDWLTIKPAKTFNLPFGKLEEGNLADLTLVDLEKTITIDKNKFYSKGKNTPFDQYDVRGIPVLTMFEGEVVYEEVNNE
ncbi:dihydroorotase [Allobacillus sp. GCM10007491]|uniref:Dihydroorotase n=1 Tax=Allobacillus saliphilus TaxID=2912308 RepID=A0A941CVR5_9BACI|nr:dihydroorotase [Allobacillus saliphilus]MBR7554908.1 dihydroorotase [Allobacillus saliphilus]